MIVDTNVPVGLLLLITVVAYLIGGLPFGYWVVRLTAGQDIRTLGSGNIGATNVHRSVGQKAGFTVLVLDILKGFVAVYLAALVTQRDSFAVALAVAAVMLGHCYPVFLRFKGGKAVACYIGAALYVAPLALLSVAVVFLAIVGLTRFISLGSIVGALLLPVCIWLLYAPASSILIAFAFAALLIVYRHKGNIDRLRKGRENEFSLKGKTA